MSLRRAIGKFGLWVGGWKAVNSIPKEIRKCVCILAPHTSIEDFFVGWAFFWSQDLHFKVMMKAEFFKNGFMRWALGKLGGIPVDRGKQNHLVEQMVDMFCKNDDVFLAICPEATRKKVNKWKKGFYVIAQGANVPVVLGFEDFKKKTCGFDTVFYPTGDFDADMTVIYDYYKDVKAKFPEKFNLDEMYRQPTNHPSPIETR